MQKAELGWGKTKENAQFLFMLAKLRPVKLRFGYAGLFGKDTEKKKFLTALLPYPGIFTVSRHCFFPLKDESRSMLDRLRWARHCQATLTWNQQFASWRALWWVELGNKGPYLVLILTLVYPAIINKVKSQYNLSFCKVGIILYCHWKTP